MTQTAHIVSIKVSGTTVDQALYTINVRTDLETLFQSCMTTVSTLIANDFSNISLMPMMKSLFDAIT